MRNLRKQMANGFEKTKGIYLATAFVLILKLFVGALVLCYVELKIS